MSLSCRYIWICVGEFFEFLLIPCFYSVSFNWRQSYLFSRVCSIKIPCIQRVFLKLQMQKPYISIGFIQEENEICNKKCCEIYFWNKKCNRDIELMADLWWINPFFILLLPHSLYPCVQHTHTTYTQCVLWFYSLTISGLKGDSNCLRSNFFQSISWKKAFSMISPCGLLGEPNLVFAFLSNNFRKCQMT